MIEVLSVMIIIIVIIKGPDDKLATRAKIMKLNSESKYIWNKQFSIEDHMIYSLRKYNITIIRMDPLFTRSDSHPHNLDDCLHYSLPGPINIFSRLFYHLIKFGEEHWRKSDYSLVV